MVYALRQSYHVFVAVSVISLASLVRAQLIKQDGSRLESSVSLRSERKHETKRGGPESSLLEASAMRAWPSAAFDWEMYIAQNPDIAGSVHNEEAAWSHYILHGRADGRVTEMPRIVLLYTACSGLINQHYSHIAAFALAATLGADIILPPALTRETFGKTYSQVQWSAVPLRSVLDVDQIMLQWRKDGMRVHKTPSGCTIDFNDPKTAFHRCGIKEDHVVQLHEVYQQHWDLSELAGRARDAIIGRTKALREGRPSEKIGMLYLSLPCTFFMLRTQSCLPLISRVTRSLPFAPSMHQLADFVVAKMEDRGVGLYNGLHLRIEADAGDWRMLMGGEQVRWREYKRAMAQGGFSAAWPLYIASGILTYGDKAGLQNVRANLGSHFGSSFHYKELYLHKNTLAGLNAEQNALIDFLILIKCNKFVGFSPSTFSYFIREYRTLTGVQQDRSHLLKVPSINSEILFNATAVIS